MRRFTVCSVKVSGRGRAELIDEKERMGKNMLKQIKAFWKEEDGIGVVEIILILVVLIMLIVIFRTQITDIVSNAFSQINGDSKTINKRISIK